MKFFIPIKGVHCTMNTSGLKMFVVLFLFDLWSSGVIFSQPNRLQKPDVFGNVWTLKKIKRDALLPAGKWKTFASDIYGFLWVGGESGLIRLDPRKPENGWNFFLANDDYKGGAVQTLNSPVDGLMRVTLKSHEIYEVDIDSKGKQIANKIVKNEKAENPVAWKNLSPMPYSAHDVFGVELNGKIYIPGGQAPHGFPALMKTFNHMFIYDTKNDTWQLSSPMKIQRRYCSVGILDGKIWVVGGYIIDGSNQGTNTVEIYDPVTNSWSDGPMLNVPCVQSIAAVVKGRLYVIFSNEERTINYTFSISPGETTWRSDPPPPFPILQTDGCELDNKIYIIVPAVGLIMYDPALKTWQTDFPAIPGTKAPRAAAVVNYKNQVWVISGADVEDEKIVWIFSPRESKWTKGPSVPKSIRWADGIEVNGKLYVFGGATYSERHEIFVFWNTIYTLKDSNELQTNMAKTFYIALNGSDSNSGTKNNPFLTLERARDEIRYIKKNQGLPSGGVIIIIQPGIYIRNATFFLSEEDGGTVNSPVVYKAENKNVRFLGGRVLSGWEQVKNPDILERLKEQVRGKVLQVDMKALRINDLGIVDGKPEERAELICNSQYLTLARYPDSAWTKIVDVPQNGENRYVCDGSVHYGRFVYEGEEPKLWKDLSDIWVHGFWVYDWSEEYQKIARLDIQKREIFPQFPYHNYGYKSGQRFYFLNVLEELDQPGEWYLDRKTAILYILPPGEQSRMEVIFPELRTPMIILNDTKYVKVTGITFEGSRMGAIKITDGTHNEITGCTFRNLGDAPVIIDGGTFNGVRSCNIYEIAATGIVLLGGDRKTLTPSNNYVDNCEIHHYARIRRTYNPAIRLGGVGNRISHCYIHDAPHEGIHYEGNNHIIEYCEFTQVAQETGDVGCIYTNFDWTYMGHVIRYNYFHNIHGPGNLGCFIIYLDMPCGGVHLYGNIFEDVDWVFHTNSGRGIVIENNIFNKCEGLSFQMYYAPEEFQEGGSWQMIKRLKDVNFDKPPYSEEYPVLLGLAKDLQDSNLLQRMLPKDNVVRNNISFGSKFLRFIGPVNLDEMSVENNLISNDVIIEIDGKIYPYGNEEITMEFEKSGNIIMKGNPGFRKGSLRDKYTPKQSSPAWKLGFKPIPFDNIGLQNDENIVIKKVNQ